MPSWHATLPVPLVRSLGTRGDVGWPQGRHSWRRSHRGARHAQVLGPEPRAFTRTPKPTTARAHNQTLTRAPANRCMRASPRARRHEGHGGLEDLAERAPADRMDHHVPGRALAHPVWHGITRCAAWGRPGVVAGLLAARPLAALPSTQDDAIDVARWDAQREGSNNPWHYPKTRTCHPMASSTPTHIRMVQVHTLRIPPNKSRTLRTPLRDATCFCLVPTYAGARAGPEGYDICSDGNCWPSLLAMHPVSAESGVGRRVRAMHASL